MTKFNIAVRWALALGVASLAGCVAEADDDPPIEAAGLARLQAGAAERIPTTAGRPDQSAYGVTPRSGPGVGSPSTMPTPANQNDPPPPVPRYSDERIDDRIDRRTFKSEGAPPQPGSTLLVTQPSTRPGSPVTQPASRSAADVPAADATAAWVPDGFSVEVVTSGLTYPTSVEFDDAGQMYVAEAGYSYGDPTAKPRILCVDAQGQTTVVLEGDGLEGPINDLLFHDGRLYVSHRGKVSTLSPADGSPRLRDLVTGLPSEGDHQNNQLTVGPDGMIYLSQGTATNSGVVGIDNFKMGWLKEHPDFHDRPAQQVKFRDRTYETPNPLASGQQTALTGPYQPFTTAKPGETTVPASQKPTGVVYRFNPDGSGLEVYAWGFRNPFGLLWAGDTLWGTENGFDVRGSRPIAEDKEDLYIIKEDAWYGFPDYGSGIPVTDPRFRPENKPQPQFLMAEHPPVEQPIAAYPNHAAVTKLDVSPGGAWGDGMLYIAFFGHMAPMTGDVEEHGGHRVVRFNPATGESETFFTSQSEMQGHSDSGGQHQHGGSSQNSQSHAGQAGHDGGQRHGISPGPRRLMDVRFGPDGAMYIADFGVMVVDEQGPHPVPKTGVVWRVVPAHGG